MRFFITIKGEGTKEVSQQEYLQTEQKWKWSKQRQKGCPDLANFQITRRDGSWIEGEIRA